MLTCTHGLHQRCWEAHVAAQQGGQSVDCPECHEKVPLFLVS